MAEITTRIRKWGNSFGILLPLESLRSRGLKEGEEIDVVILRKKNTLRETFGKVKFSKPVSQLMKEMDKEMYDV